MRSPWTGTVIWINDLHAVELVHLIRETEKHHGLNPLSMRGWTRQAMIEYLSEIK